MAFTRSGCLMTVDVLGGRPQPPASRASAQTLRDLMTSIDAVAAAETAVTATAGRHDIMLRHLSLAALLLANSQNR